MPKKIVKTVYFFDDLSDDAKEKALENYRDCNVEFDSWYEYVIDDHDGKLEEKGYTSPVISFRGFASQGDGASFTAGVNLEKWLKNHKRKTYYKRLLSAESIGDFTAKIIRTDHHYSHENTVRAEVECSDSVHSLAMELESELTRDVRELSREIYKALENEYFYQTSDESVKDTIISNEWTFTEKGKPDNG